MTNLITKAKDFYTGHKKLVVVLGILFLILLPQLTTSNYVRGVLARIIVYATIASGLNIINGYSGQSCLGIVGFTCIGAYSGALMSTELGMTFLPSLLCTIVLCAIAGFIVSIPTLKLNGMFLSIITLGFSEMMRLTALNWQDLTNGPLGIKGIPTITIFGFKVESGAPFYYLALVVLLLVVFILNRLLNSRIGRAWISIREDQDAARSLGVKVSHYRCINFMTGAIICGTMGVFLGHYYRYVSPDMFTLDEGFSVLSMCVVRHQRHHRGLSLRLRMAYGHVRPAHHRDDVGTAPGPVRRQGQRHRGQYLPPAAGVLAQKGKAPVKGGAVIWQSFWKARPSANTSAA